MAFVSGVRAFLRGEAAPTLQRQAAASQGCGCAQTGRLFAANVAACAPRVLLNRKALEADARKAWSTFRAGDFTGKQLARGLWGAGSVGACFVLGEIVGKGTVIGYQPPGVKPKEHH